LPAKGETGFRILSSQVKGKVATGIPADAATCADCLCELSDPTDRRYRYPFTNCTNCGPRFTITRRIPYDRPQTSMAKFTMCAACQAEYDDPLNRRFHAQPNACWDCGPRLWLEAVDLLGLGVPGLDSETWEGSSRIRPEDGAASALKGHGFSHAESGPQKEGALAPEGHVSIAEAIARLLAGQILAIKGIGGFHLSADATNSVAVQRLRERKHRYGKPLAVMVRDIAAARALCALTPEDESQLQTPARPIVLARARENNGIAPEVAPGIPWLGVFLPYAPLQHLLFADNRLKALVMTSANLSEEPIAIDNDEARARLRRIADSFLMHDREILQRCDDSVIALVDGAPQLMRRARGFVPLGIELPFEVPPMLAVGGHLKSVFTLAQGRFAYQSQHLGDLENPAGLEFFQESLAHLMQTFEIEPEVVVRDLHPGYLSTTWANDWAAARGLPVIAIQHHHAHIAACMAEHELEGPVIGLSLDGTGYGTDGKIWGGEVLVARLDGPSPAIFDRFAHLEYVPMPGGEAAIRKPWRMAAGHLHAAGIELNDPIIAKALGATAKELTLMLRMIERSLNTPLTSSCGRLFDAVAAVVLERREVDYEAQAAIELEGIAVDEPDESSYACELSGGNWGQREPTVIRVGSLWSQLLADLRAGVTKPRIAARFHSGVARAFIDSAIRVRAATGIHLAAMSGGCMHNRRLSRLLRAGLQSEGFEVFQHWQVSPGDGGLSYGQAAVAAAVLENRRQQGPSGP
jgi:hydrogenase maturation protein HypF